MNDTYTNHMSNKTLPAYSLHPIKDGIVGKWHEILGDVLMCFLFVLQTKNMLLNFHITMHKYFNFN